MTTITLPNWFLYLFTILLILQTISTVLSLLLKRQEIERSRLIAQKITVTPQGSRDPVAKPQAERPKVPDVLAKNREKRGIN